MRKPGMGMRKLTYRGLLLLSVVPAIPGSVIMILAWGGDVAPHAWWLISEVN